jgi:hypothetical protein
MCLQRSPTSEAERFANPALLDACATTLNQNHRYDDKQHSGNNPDDRCGFHSFSPFLHESFVGLTALPERERDLALEPRPPVHNASEPAGGVRPVQRRRLGEFAPPDLPGAGATALNDDAEYDGTEHSSGDTNDGHGIHGSSPFSRKRCIERCFKSSRLQFRFADHKHLNGA